MDKQMIQVPKAWIEGLLEVAEKCKKDPNENEYYLYGYIESARSFTNLLGK